MNKADLFHAVDGGGNCLPGPTRPFSIVRCGPDMVNCNTSGYASGEDIRHFSHTHVAGTGGEGRYGNIGIAPYGYWADERVQGQAYEDEYADPGYYRVTLAPRQSFGELGLAGGILGELTSTHHCAVHRYTFDEDHEPCLRFNLGARIAGRSLGGSARWISPRVMVAKSEVRGGWGHNVPYTIYTRIELDCDMGKCEFTSEYMPQQHKLNGDGPELVGRVSLEGVRQVEIKVGISFVSNAHAQRHLEQEVGPRGFDDIRAEASQQWETHLNRYQVEGGLDDDRVLWKTMWMRLYTMPSDLGTEEVPWFHAQHRQFNDLYCLWDSVRCANSLFALVDPQFASDLCNSLVEISEQTGWLPDAWIMGASARVQGGCSSAVLFSEGIQKRLPDLDATRLLKALNRSQENDSPDPFFLGRWPEWKRKGYLNTKVPNCASRSVEYAFHDHNTAIVAGAASENRQAIDLQKRAARIWDSWTDEHKCFGPRNANGDFVSFDPWKPACRDFWADPHFYEGTGHDYALTAWHLISDLVERHGGREAFAAHLDEYMVRCYHWKEINLHAPWLYHACDMPHRSTQALRKVMDAHLEPGRLGMSDNEDMGAWSSWWITGAMGFVPVPGSTLYLIGCPRFQKVRIQRGLNSGTLTIQTNREPNASDVVIAARLNGEPLDRAWVNHDELAGDCLLELDIADTPSDWGSQNLPPF